MTMTKITRMQLDVALCAAEKAIEAYGPAMAQCKTDLAAAKATKGDGWTNRDMKEHQVRRMQIAGVPVQAQRELEHVVSLGQDYGWDFDVQEFVERIEKALSWKE